MKSNIQKIYNKVFNYCKSENFAGFDPFDGLNSTIFQIAPLKNFTLARLVWLQTVKRSPINLRPFLRIKKGVNPKGLALFALGELSRFRVTKNAKHAENAKNLLEKLSEKKIEISDSKIAFSYNFDWQSRAFFAPKGTPTIVPTAFATFAFLEGFEVFKDDKYLKIAEKICNFIIEDLNRPFENENEICFSYTPIDRSVILNASLLAGEVLASVGKITQHENHLELAKKSANFVINRQKDNGAWTYGSKLRHSWVDNFHTAYILLSLQRLKKKFSPVQENFDNSIKKGLNFWIENLFIDNEIPKYFDKRTFPIDIHSSAAAIITLCELNEVDDRCLPLAEKILNWSIKNMFDEKGFFYYQKHKFYTIKTPFSRWSNAWMTYAIALFIESKNPDLT